MSGNSPCSIRHRLIFCSCIPFRDAAAQTLIFRSLLCSSGQPMLPMLQVKWLADELPSRFVSHSARPFIGIVTASPPSKPSIRVAFRSARWRNSLQSATAEQIKNNAYANCARDTPVSNGNQMPGTPIALSSGANCPTLTSTISTHSNALDLHFDRISEYNSQQVYTR